MVNRIKLTLEQPEYAALLKLAIQELRNPADQARFIIRAEAHRRGLLPKEYTDDFPSALDKAFSSSKYQVEQDE